jgi:type I site-specific restriction-modification system R (restriction) subunit
MKFCKSPSSLSNEIDSKMIPILQEMLDSNETITARAVAKKHPSLKHASSITRNFARSDLLGRFQMQQNQYRAWQERMPKRSREQIASQLAQKDSRIAELERQIEILRISHLAMIRTVGELGGMGKLLKLYEGYREIRSELDRMAVLPKSEVKPFVLAPPATDD